MHTTIKIKRPRQNEVLFYIAYGLILFFDLLSRSFYFKYFIGLPYSLVRLTACMLLFAREFLKRKYTLKSFLMCVLFVVLFVMSELFSSSSALVFTLLIVFCARDIDLEDIGWFTVWISVFTLILIVASSYLGIIPNYLEKSATRTRYYLGFRYALFGPSILLNIILLYLYLTRNRIKLGSLIICGIVSLYFFLYTNARMSFAFSILAVVAFWILKVNPLFFNNKKIVCYIMIFAFLICFIISMFFTVTYNSGVRWQAQLNSILGNRLQLGQTSLLSHGVSFLGQRIEYIGNGLDVYGNRTSGTYNYVDSSYVQMTQTYGLIFTTVWLMCFSFAQYRFYKVKNYPMMVCLTFVALRGVIDDLVLRLESNTFYFAITISLLNFRDVVSRYAIQESEKVKKVKRRKLVWKIR